MIKTKTEKRPKKKHFNTILHVKINTDMMDALQAQAVRLDIAVSQLVRMVLNEYLLDFGVQARVDNGITTYR